MRNDSIKLNRFAPFLLLTSVWFAGCSDDNPELGADLIDDSLKPVLSSVSTDTLTGSFTVEYVDYNPVTASSTRLIIGSGSTDIGRIDAAGIFRLIPSTKSFEPDSLVKIISARISLTPFFVTKNSVSVPYSTGDTTQPFNIKISVLGERTYFSQKKLKDDVPVSGLPVADTTFTGNQWNTFSFAASDTNWVRKMIQGMKSVSDTSTLYEDNYGLKIYSGNSGNRTLGIYGFASNESVLNYDYEPQLKVLALVKSGSKTDTLSASFYLGSANQLSKFTQLGSWWSGNNFVVLAGLSGLRPLIKFDNPSIVPSKVLIYSALMNASYDTTVSKVIDSDYFAVWNSTTDKVLQSPGLFSTFGKESGVSLSVASLAQYWSLNSTDKGFFLIPSGELNRAEMQAFYLNHSDPDKKLSFTFTYTGL